MAHLLTRPTFDRYSLSEGQVTTFCTFLIEGNWQRSFMDPDESDPAANLIFTPWERVRPYCLSLRKGKRTPLSFKFVFIFPREDLAGFLKKNDIAMSPDNIFGLYLNLSFRDGLLIATTGTSLRAFSLDKSLDQAWADYLLSFPTTYATCHCTGTEAFGMLKEKMGDRLEYALTGKTFEF